MTDKPLLSYTVPSMTEKPLLSINSKEVNIKRWPDPKENGQSPGKMTFNKNSLKMDGLVPQCMKCSIVT